LGTVHGALWKRETKKKEREKEKAARKKKKKGKKISSMNVPQVKNAFQWKKKSVVKGVAQTNGSGFFFKGQEGKRKKEAQAPKTNDQCKGEMPVLPPALKQAGSVSPLCRLEGDSY